MATPAPTRRIVRERRSGAVWAGVVLVVAAVVALGIGGLTLNAAQALEVATAEGRAVVGNEITFDAESGERYVILLAPEPGATDFVEERIARLKCEVTDESGTTTQLDTSSVSVRSTTSVGTIATTFTASGPVEVHCEWTSGAPTRGIYSVARERGATRTTGYVLSGLGIIVGLAGAAALVVGFRGRQVIQAIPSADGSDSSPS